jgi:hypothetical protein
MSKILKVLNKLSESRALFGTFAVDASTGNILQGPYPTTVEGAWSEVKKLVDYPSAILAYRDTHSNWNKCTPTDVTTDPLGFEVNDGRNGGINLGKNNLERTPIVEYLDKNGKPLILNQKVLTPDGVGTLIKNSGDIAIVYVKSIDQEKTYNDTDLEAIDESSRTYYEVSRGIDGPTLSKHSTIIGAKRNCKTGYYIHKYTKSGDWDCTLDSNGSDCKYKPYNR